MANLPARQRRLRDRQGQDHLAESAALTRPEWLALGWTDEAVAHQVRTDRWVRPSRGIVVAAGKAYDIRTRVRAAWLAGGRGATIGGLAAAYLVGLEDAFPPSIEVQVPHGRTPARRAGLRFRHVRRRRASRRIDGVDVTTVEETVLDLVGDARSASDAVRWVERACGRRLSTPDRLLAVLGQRPRLRHRRLVLAMCSRLADGETTWLERRFVRKVLSGHGLPAARSQVRRRMDGRTTYSDLEVEAYDVVIELDGRLGHEDERGRFRDRRRDNAHAARGRVTLRYGWVDSTRAPCAVAAEVAEVLRTRGWTGQPQRCGSSCAMP